MATTNYSLPTLESTALFDLVTDYNALANATDAALASVAGLIPTETITEMQGQISALQTLTGSQGTQITTLQSQMSTANGNISTLQSGLETANSNIGVLQTGLQTANQNINNIKSDFSDYSEFTSTEYTGTNVFSGANSNSIIVLMKNTSETIIKLFGSFGTQGNVSRAQVPGVTWANSNPVYGIKSNIKAINKVLTNGYLVQFIGVSQSAVGGGYNGSVSYAIGSDGYVYFAPSQNSGVATAIVGNYLIQMPVYIGNPIGYPSVDD